jgi:hypothetical protein
MQSGQSYCFLHLRVVLSFSCSCLVCSSPSEVGQFHFECCPPVQEISSVIHYLPALEVAFRYLCLLRVQHWEFSSLPWPPFFGEGSAFHPPTLLWMLDYSSLTVFQFCGAVWFWMLVSGSGDPLLPCFREWLITHSLSAFADILVFIYWWFGAEFSSLPHPFLWCRFSIPPAPSISMLDYSSIFVIHFCGRGISLPRGFMITGVVRGFLSGVWCSPVCSVNWYTGRFEAHSGSEKWHQIFSVQCIVGKFSMG